MKKTIIFMVILLVLLVACQTSELPPEPGTPGEGKAKIDAKTGAGIMQVPKGYAPPVDIFDNDKQITSLKNSVIEIEDDQNSARQVVGIEHKGGLVYNKGYYYSTVSKKWIQFKIDGDKFKESNWLNEKGSSTLDIPRSDLTIGENYIISYSCKKQNNEWKCGCREENDCGYWMLNTFLLRETDLPPEPEEPGNIKLADLYYYPSGDILEVGKGTVLSALLEAKNDVCKDYKSIGAEIILPDGSVSDATLKTKGGAGGASSAGDFSCTVSLSQPYIPNMIGDYTIDVRQDDWEGKDVKVHSGYFIAYGKAEIDSILLRYGIKNSKYIEEENSRAGYFNEGTEVFMAQYKANNDVNIIDASAARGQNAIEDAMREWLVENVLGADERSEADFNVAEIEANDNKHTVYSVVWLDKETKKPSRIEYRWTSKGKVVIIELYLGIRIEEKELEAALNDFNDVAKAYLERYPSDTSVNVWNYILKVTRAEYKLPTGPRTDVLTIEISNPLEEEIKQSEFNLIFTGNGQTIKIGTVGYRMEELTDDIEGKTSISFTFKGTGNAPLFAKEQCEKDISIGLISKSIVNPGAITDVPKGSRGILFLQDVVLDCGNGAKKEGIEEVEDTLGLGKSKEYPLDGIKYNVNIKSVSGEGNDASAIIDVNGELTTSLRKNEYKILKDGAVIKIGEVFTNIKGNIDETALVEFKISTVDSTLGGACSFDSEGGLTVPGYISTNANIGLDEELHYSKEERKFEDACCVNCLTAPSDKGKNIREWFCENGIGRSVLQKCDCENGACLLDLSNYPNLFIIGGKFDAQIVIGDSAHTDEIFAASDISAGLSNAIIRVSAIEKVDAQNLILVGTPDSNPLIKQFTGNVVSNYGYIGIYKNGNYAAVVVTGKTTKGVIEAAKVLAKGGLSGITHSIPEP